jgi:serine O-acetyltransferase
MIKRIREDIQTVFRKDPAARSLLEVVTCYPGFHAIWMHRISHALWRHHWHLPARMISHANRFLTGVEIHPGARIGRRFFVDHGSGVVIGETAEIGDDVLLYQGVILGGVSLEKEKRHPTICSQVMIGAASLVVNDVPPHAIAVGVPARIGLGFTGRDIQKLTDNKLPDPIAEAFQFLGKQMETLEKRMAKVEQKQGVKIELDQYIEEKKQEIRKIFSAPANFNMGEGI